MVVLVDESGSETPAKIADEKATTLEIATSMLSPQSRVTVIGFGGVNNIVPDQDPTNVACQPTITSAANLGYLTSCVNGLYRRTEKDGDDTDYAVALGQAMSYLKPDSTSVPQSPPGATKVILMMTDGAVDVHRNMQQYGADWREGELTQIDDQLSIAKQDNVQFWALGFGTDVGVPVDGTIVTKAQALTYLDNMAAKGAPAICDGQRAPVQPYARWVDNPDDAFITLGQLSADASCSGYTGKKVHVGGGVTNASLTVQIPDYASSGVISVDRVSPKVGVTFVQPNGQPWTDSSALSGQDSSPVETLRLTDLTSSEVGPWTIKLTAPKNLASELVRASAFWKGLVRAVISANPTSAKLGQSVCSELSLLGPRGPLSDPADVTDLQVGITVSGDGVPQQQVPVSSAGPAGCQTTGAGQYAGTFAAPSRSGALTFTGIAAGYGLSTTYVPATVTVGPVAAQFTAVIQYPTDQAGLQVQAGTGLRLSVVFTNHTGSAQKVKLAVAGTGTSPSIAGTSSELTVPPTPSKTVPFSVYFPPNSPKGLTQVQVTVAAEANPSNIYASAPIDVQVTKPPGFWAQYLKYIIGAIILLILLAVFVYWRRKVSKWRMDVRGLVAYLQRDGAPVSELPAPGRPGNSFRFVIKNLEERSPLLDYEASGLPPYTVRRSGNREVDLITPAGLRNEDVVLSGPAVPVAGTKLELAFDEDRKRPRPWWAAGADRGPRRRRNKDKQRVPQWTPPAPEQEPPDQPSVGTETVSPAQPASQEPTSELW